jgi:glycosyltransferase involved in cell wall biosynthesis
MRILQVHKDFEPFGGGGGTARHIHGLAKALVAKGAELRVASLHPTIVTWPYQSMHVWAQNLRAHIAWADVVHVHGGRSKYAVAGAALAYLKGKPFVYTPHAFYDGKTRRNRAFKFLWDRSAEKFLLEKGDCTILLTDAWYNFLQTRNISIEKTVIIPNCVLEEDLPRIAPATPEERLAGNPAILTVGRLDHVKRVGDVISALAQPGLESAHLHIVGRGKEREALEALGGQLGVSARVTFHGFVNDENVAKMVAGADVFVLASEQEGLPTVLLEMLLARLPIICTRIPGNLAIANVANVKTTYDVGDVPALAALLAQCNAARVDDAAIANLRRTFLWEERVNDILAVYSTAIEARKTENERPKDGGVSLGVSRLPNQ